MYICDSNFKPFLPNIAYMQQGPPGYTSGPGRDGLMKEKYVLVIRSLKNITTEVQK